MRRSAFPIVLALCAAALAGCHHGGAKAVDLVPPQNVKMDSELLNDFYDEIADYVKLRHKAVDVVPPLPAQATSEQIAARQKALTLAILKYNRKAKQGDIFKPPIEAAFRRILTEAFTGPEGRAMMDSLKQGNPRLEGVPNPRDPSHEQIRNVTLRVNLLYPEDAPFSSVPGSLLRLIPALPEQVRYRFIGRALIVRDTEANVILDFIRDVVPDSSIPR
jgi:hypothetical protein